jgi:hypothetical protein
MGTQVFGQEFNRARQEGKDFDAALEDAVMATLTEILPEKAFGVYDGLQIGKGVINWIKTSLAEGLSEAGTSGWQQFDEQYRQGKDIGSWWDVGRRMLYEAAAGVAVGGLIGSGTLFGRRSETQRDPFRVGKISPPPRPGPQAQDAFPIWENPYEAVEPPPIPGRPFFKTMSEAEQATKEGERPMPVDVYNRRGSRVGWRWVNMPEGQKPPPTPQPESKLPLPPGVFATEEEALKFAESMDAPPEAVMKHRLGYIVVGPEGVVTPPRNRLKQRRNPSRYRPRLSLSLPRRHRNLKPRQRHRPSR